MSWEAKISGVENLTGNMLTAAHAGMLLAAEKLGIEGQRFVVENITTPYNGQPPAVFTGNLAGSVNFNVFDDQSLIRLIIGVGPSLGADRYVAPVETGARPHFPPAAALVPWVIRKLGVDEQDAKGVAFVIARKIARTGTKGHEMFSRALPELETIAVPIIEREIAQALMAAEAKGGTQ